MLLSIFFKYLLDFLKIERMHEETPSVINRGTMFEIVRLMGLKIRT